MNLHSNTTTEFVREWQGGESPLHSCMANQSRWDGADPALGQEQATFEAMFNVLPAATVFTDLYGEIRPVNPAFTTLFGSPPQDVIGKPIDLLYVCRADDQAAGRFQPHSHTGASATPVEVRYRTNDGATFIGETVVTAVKDEAGRVLGWLRLIRDITDRKHADALVEANLARLAKKHRYESIVSAVAHSVHQSTTLQAVLENAVEAMRTHIERIDAIEIFLREGEEAVEFYRRALGAEVTMLVRFKDSPEPHEPGMVPPGARDKVMHMSVRIGETTVLASDGRCEGRPSFQGFSLSLTVSHEAERLFAALADGGQVQMPLTKTFFSSRFGMVADRFGVSWMIYVAP